MSDLLRNKRVGLFVPCYVDQWVPRVAFATLEVLRRIGVRPEYPRQQTCCGQPLANMGCAEEARPLAEQFVRVFADFDYVVCPSGSCVATVRGHYASLVADDTERERVCSRVYELCEFLTAVAQIDRFEGHFPFRVGLHQSCHSLRSLRLGVASELVQTPRNPIAGLLSGLEGLRLVDLERVDECCGFGGIFSVEETGVSAMMGQDRIRDHAAAGAEVIASTDMSCLLHLDGLLRREGVPLRVMHVAEILAEAEPVR